MSSLDFIKNADWQPGIAALRAKLLEHLGAGERVLWLVSGGSNIAAEVEIMQSLPPELTPYLAVTLTDERYVPVGHADSNWQQLLSAGFDGGQAKLLPVLQEGLSLKVTQDRYEQLLSIAFKESAAVIGQFGMGPDGHIAGILPQSPAVKATDLVASYKGADFKRLTTSFAAIRRCTTAYLFAFGDDKKPVLEKLQAGKASLADQPAQILHELPEVYVCNDQIGDAL
jgi:6-phosphogluconolactonase/glucosamine-6-phosphate isomerase/deaminase